MKTPRFLAASILLVCALVPAFASGGKELSATGIVGNLLQHQTPAPDFTLTDQHGAPFHMADARGKVVLMTFIYTHCDDICPFISVKVKEAYSLLGADAEKVVIVAVTTDPKRDVPALTAAYIRALGLLDAWHFVGGDPRAVQAVWASYGIGVTVDPDTAAVAPPKEVKMDSASSDKDKATAMSGPDSDAPIQGLSQSGIKLAGRIASQFGGGYDVGHSAPFWIVDKRDRIAVGMDADAAPADIATNIRALLKQK